MDADDHVDDQLENAEDVRVVGARVGAIEELEHPADAKDAVDSHEGEVDAEVQVQQVGRQQTDHVQRKLPRVDVVTT